MSFLWCWGLTALNTVGTFLKELSPTLFLPMKWPDKHKAQIKFAQYILKTCTTLKKKKKLQRRIIVSLTTCPQIPSGIHLDLRNFISQLSQIKTHHRIHGNEGEKEKRDACCSAEFSEDASHSSKCLAHDQVFLYWSLDPRCLPGDGVYEDGLDRQMRLTSSTRLLIGRTEHIKNAVLTAGLEPSDTLALSLIQIDFFCSFSVWMNLLYHQGTCNKNKKTNQIWLNAPIYL